MKLAEAVAVFVVFSAFNYVDSQEVCKTPDNKVGQCIPAKQCKPVTDFIQYSPKPISQADAIKLGQYLCGYEGNGARVCCPSEPIIAASASKVVTTPPPPDVTKHKNLHLLPEECGFGSIEDKIRNGKNAGLREYPWMAILSYRTNKGPSFNCGGTVINERYILTAAHCITGTRYPLIGVRVGEYDTSSEKDCADEKCLPPVQDLVIEKVLYHPEYNSTLYANDIGLLRVSKMKLNDSVQTICLPITEENRNRKFKNAVVTGWGFTTATDKRLTDILQTVDLPIRNLSTCIDAYKIVPQINLSYKQVCAGGINQKDSCGGDSGGPLQVAVYLNGERSYVQYGVVSIGHANCGTEGVPGIYSQIVYYLKWILDNIEP